MKILFGSWPGYGHLLPMLPLVRAAQRGGHDVLVTPGRTSSPCWSGSDWLPTRPG